MCKYLRHLQSYRYSPLSRYRIPFVISGALRGRKSLSPLFLRVSASLWFTRSEFSTTKNTKNT